MRDEPDRVRVIVVTPDFPPVPGGIQLLVHRVVRHAGRLRARVVTIDAPAAAEFDRREGLDVRRTRRTRWHGASVGLLNALAVREAVKFDPAVVLSAHIVASPAAWAIRQVLGVPVVQYLYAKEIGARPRLAAFAVRRADATIVISRHTERLAVRIGGDPRRLHRITPGVDLPAEPEYERLPPRTILTIGSLESRYKGFDVLVRALALVRGRVPDARLVIVGDGPLRREIELLAAAHELDGAVRLTGTLPDAERDGWLRRAHVFAMPSRLPPGGVGGEGFGIVYLEAGAHGLPVVAGNVGGAQDAVVDGETGILVEPTDHVAVADAIADLLLDPARADALGRAGEAHARDFAWPRVAERVQDLLVAVARGTP